MDSDILTEIAKEESVAIQPKVEVEAPYAADEYEDEEENYHIQQEELYSKFNGSKGKNQKTKVLNNVELPPKSKKIEVEVYDFPEELKEGECLCGAEEACPK